MISSVRMTIRKNLRNLLNKHRSSMSFTKFIVSPEMAWYTRHIN